MVLSLVDLSLRSIMNGIEDGEIQHPHLLPPKLRERVFETATKQNLASHPIGLPLLTSVEFLNGMTTISANSCSNATDSRFLTATECTLEFLERLISSLATKLQNGQTVGASITKLNLMYSKMYSDVISKVSDLIAHCPNTTSLAFHESKSHSKEGYRPLNENENSVCNRVMENLINLSVVSNGERILDSDRPIINFKKLKTLKLDNCYVDNESWPKVLEKIPLLENLHLIDVLADESGMDWILPFPLPHLKLLKALEGIAFKCNEAFVNKLDANNTSSCAVEDG